MSEEIEEIVLSESQKLLNELARRVSDAGITPNRIRASIGTINRIMADVTEEVTRWEEGIYHLMTPHGELRVHADTTCAPGDVFVDNSELAKNEEEVAEADEPIG